MFHKFSLNVLRKTQLQVFSYFLVFVNFFLQRKSFASLRKTIYDIFNQNDPSHPGYIAASFNPAVPLQVYIIKHYNFNINNIFFIV